MKCSIGVFAYNEEKNIGSLLDALLNQELNQVEIDEIFVVASGCTDKTVSFAQEFEKKDPTPEQIQHRADPRVKVLVQEKREGKYSAINLFLKNAKNEILVMESGDTIPDKNAVERLVFPFSDSKTGMTGAKPVPIDNPNTFLGFTTNLLWDLHHQICLENPKMGEMVAFRKVISEIPPIAMDEATIEYLIKDKGYKVIYVPEAIVYNKGPETISDFLKQRRRNFAGHLHLKEKFGYEVSTLNPFKVFSLILKNFKLDLRHLLFTPFSIFLEGLGRFLGWWDYRIKKKDYVIWDLASTARKVIK